MFHNISIPPFLKRIIKILAWIFVSFFTLIIFISLLLLIPSVQSFVTKKVTKIISEKANMKVEIGSIHIAFPKAIKVAGIFIEDNDADTLLYCNKIVIDTDLIPIIRKKINIDYLLIDGLKVNIYKNSSDSSLNISPLLDVFTYSEKIAKEKPESTWKIGFNELELKNIKADYFNHIDSSGITLKLGHLVIESNAVELISGKLDLKSIDLQETFISILVAPNSGNTVSAQTKNASPSIPFDIKLEELNLINIHFSLFSGDDKMAFIADLQQVNVKPKTLDLKTFNVELEQFQADGVDVFLKILPTDSMDRTSESSPVIESTTNHEFTFGDFPWKFLVDKVNISNACYKMDLGSEVRDWSGMDYRHMEFSNFNVSADSVYFDNNSAGANVKEFRVKEISGAELTHAEGNFSMDNQSIRAIDVNFSTLKSSVAGTASLGFTSFQEIGKNIGKLTINADLNGNVHVPDIRPFTSVLDQYPLLANFDQIEVNNVKVHGTLDNLLLENCNAAMGNSIAFEVNGTMQGLPSSDFSISLVLDTLSASSTDINILLPDTLLPSQISLPENIGLSGAFHYRPDSMGISLKMKSNFGNIFTEAQLIEDELSSTFQIRSFNVGQLLNDSIYGEIALKGEFIGTQSDGIFSSFNTKFDIQSFDFLENTYHNIQLDLEKKDNLISLYSSIEDSLISLTALGEVMLLDSSNHYNLEINVKNADLYGMNLSNEYFMISGKIDINTDFTSEGDIDGTFILSDMLLANSVDSYEISEIKLVSDIKKEYTNFNFTSDIFNSSLTGNTKIIDLKTAFNNHIDNYFEIPDSLLSEKEYHFEFDLSMNKPDFFT